MLKILKDIKIADYFTFLNLISGFLAIYFLFLSNIRISVILLYVAVIMDGVDGIVAENFEKSLLGKNLDSLADIVSFGVYPALLVSKIALVSVFISSFYLLAGIIRLARFNVMEREDFIGCPITVPALIIASATYLYFDALLINISTLLLSFLMISDVSYPKIKRKEYMILAGLIILLAMLFKILVYLIILGSLVYVIYPFLEKFKK